MTSTQRTSIGWATAALGLAGLVCGIVALAADIPFLGLIAGLLAVSAGAAGFGAAYVPPDRPEPKPPTDPAPPTKPAAVNDQITGLRSEAYFKAAASDRIDAARRYLRPVALMLFELRTSDGGEVAPGEAGETLTETLREADMICRRDDDSFAVLLEDTPETGALLVVERLRPALRAQLGDVILRAGVACYPAHGLDIDGIWILAESALAAAKLSERDSTQVAQGD